MRIFYCLLFAAALPFSSGVLFATQPQQDGLEKQSTWNGYDQFHFKIDGRPAYYVAPQKMAPGKPWIWRARFPNYHPEIDIALLRKGMHVAYVDVSGMFGSPQAVAIGDKFYDFLTKQHAFADRPALEGVSRGGLFIYNWAAKNPDKVACIYCDTPVCDFKSWPGGRGTGVGSTSAWQQCLKAFALDEDQALRFAQNPIDHAETISQAKIPILHIVSENDRVVPPNENTYLLQKRLGRFGHELNVISVPTGTTESNGHHFDHPAIGRVVDFVARQTGIEPRSPRDLLHDSRRIVFLGDSITYAGQSVAYFNAWLLTQDFEKLPKVINVGLPSETVSGLSEVGHAGGRFPRPDLAERLDRVLAVTRPDLVFACYGINCGIYQPLEEDRFQRYQQGIGNLKRKVESTGATLVLITPPFFDDQRAKKSFSYNAVLDKYSAWLLENRNEGWRVVDLHGPMTEAVASRRRTNPEFTFQADGVHPNNEGHWLIAVQLIRWLGDDDAAAAETPQNMLTARRLSPAVLDVSIQQMNVLRDAYLTSAGHQRPGIKKGLPLQQAEQKANELSKRLRGMAQKRP